MLDPQAKCRLTILIFKSSMQYSGACVKFPRTLRSTTAHGRLAPPVIHDVHHHHHHHDKGPPDMSYSQIGFVPLDPPFISFTFLLSFAFVPSSLPILDQNRFSLAVMLILLFGLLSLDSVTSAAASRAAWGSLRARRHLHKTNANIHGMRFPNSSIVVYRGADFLNDT
jgi:hypothetical protein